MSVDLIKGIHIRIEGEEGSTNGLSWDVFRKIGDSLQALITHLVQYGIEDSTADPNAFEIEIFDFNPGSAIPSARLKTHPQQNLYKPNGDVGKQVAKEFDFLMSISNSGDYNKLSERYTDSKALGLIAADLYGFANAADTSPVSLVKKTKSGYQRIYGVEKFPAKVFKRLAPNQTKKVNPEQETVIARVSLNPKAKRKVASLHQVYKNAEVSYAPKYITTAQADYELHHALLCKMYEEDKYFFIENDLLDIQAGGTNEIEAEESFHEEFDFKFRRLNELEDSKLSDRLIRAKKAFNLIVKHHTEK